MGMPMGAWYHQAVEKGLIADEGAVAPAPAPSLPAPVPSAKPRRPRPKKPEVTPLVRMSLRLVISPLMLVSEANKSGRVRAKIGRWNSVREAIVNALPAGMKFPLPCVVTFIRLASRPLDKDENLPMAFKNAKDCVAIWLGVDDADRRVRWRYKQRPAYVAGCEIRIRTREVLG